MPELPDIADYIEALKPRVIGQPLAEVRRGSPFLLRSVTPPLTAFAGRPAVEILRLGKRIALGFEGDLWLVLHLMIAGRLQWKDAGAEIPKKRGLAAFDFPTGTLILTEAGSKRRASLYAEAGRDAMLAHHPGGLEVLEASLADFTAALRRENHTVKRALTDQRVFSGIGNAYSDEILHRARLSPVAMTSKLSDAEVERLFAATRDTLATVVRAPAPGDRRGLSRQGDRLPARDGGARQVRPGLPGSAAPRSSGSATPATRPTTARAARPRAGSWPTARCPGCSSPTGPAASRSWRGGGRDDPAPSWVRKIELPWLTKTSSRPDKIRDYAFRPADAGLRDALPQSVGPAPRLCGPVLTWRRRGRP